VQPPAEVGRASYVRKLLETNILYTWRGFRATKPTAHELHYVLDNNSETWLRRLYFFPDAEGQPTLVQNARELLCTYATWKDLGPEEKADEASGQGVIFEESEREYEDLWNSSSTTLSSAEVRYYS
jgi:hypothetical protein